MAVPACPWTYTLLDLHWRRPRAGGDSTAVELAGTAWPPSKSQLGQRFLSDAHGQAFMAPAEHIELPHLGDRGRLWWLPPGGRGNGLDAEGWAPILRLDAALVDEVLRVLHDDGVPAYAAAAPPRRAANRRGHGRGGRSGSPPARYQLWVGSTTYFRAEQSLMRALPSLLGGR